MKAKGNTVVILTPGFPANENDTTCLPSRQIFVKALKENSSLNIIVLAFQYPFIKSKYKWYGTHVISFNGRNRGKLRRAKVWLDVCRSLKKIKNQNGIISIISFWLGECAFIGQRFATKYGLKHFIWLLGQDAKAGNKYYRLTKPRANNLIALSDFIAKEFFKNYGIIPQHIIPVGIDTAMFAKELPLKDIDIMGAGSLISLKRYELFVEIIKEIVVYFPGIRVLICGDGIEKEKLIAQIVRHDLQKNILLMGEVSHTVVLELMQRSKIFLHTSAYEGFGTVQAEALYAGCHVISFCKPMDEDIDHWNIVNSKEEMIQKVLVILNDPEIKYYPVLFSSAESIAKKILNLFSD